MTTNQDRKTLSDEITSKMDDLVQMSRDINTTREFVLLHWDDEAILAAESELEHLSGLSDMLLGVVKEFVKAYSMEMEIEKAFDIDGPPQPIGHPIADEIWARMPEDWTPVDLAKASGVQQKTIDLLLSGTTRKPHAKTLHKIEKALGLDKGHLNE